MFVLYLLGETTIYIEKEISIIFVIGYFIHTFLKRELRKQMILTLTYLIRYVYLICFITFGIRLLGKEGKQNKVISLLNL